MKKDARINQKQEVIKFCHQYYKLANDEFTTIRGKTQFKRLRVGQTVWIQTPKEEFEAMIMGLKLERVADMELDFLKADAEFPGFTISCKLDFVGLLNEFRAPAWQQVTLESEMTIISLKKIK